MSAPRLGAFSIMRGLLPGTANSLRCSRFLIAIAANLTKCNAKH